MPTTPPEPAEDVLADLIAKCPAHGNRTETWPECQCAAARKAAVILARMAPAAAGGSATDQAETDCSQCGGTGACNGGPCPLAPGGGAGDERRARYATAVDSVGFIGDAFPAVLDAVMAVADAEQQDHVAATKYWFDAADERREENARLRAELGQARTTVLNERAEDGDESCGKFVPDTPRAPGLCALCGDAKGWHSRLAADATGTAPEKAHPDKVAWIAEAWEGDRWMYLGTSPDRTRMEIRIAGLNFSHARWADGEPVRRRLVRATTTYTVEPGTGTAPATDGGQP